MRNEKLITAREEREWTQEKAAEKIGVSRVTYCTLGRKGRDPPSLDPRDGVRSIQDDIRTIGVQKALRKSEPRR